jgi:hypothetical protein
MKGNLVTTPDGRQVVIIGRTELNQSHAGLANREIEAWLITNKLMRTDKEQVSVITRDPGSGKTSLAILAGTVKPTPDGSPRPVVISLTPWGSSFTHIMTDVNEQVSAIGSFLGLDGLDRFDMVDIVDHLKEQYGATTVTVVLDGLDMSALEGDLQDADEDIKKLLNDLGTGYRLVISGLNLDTACRIEQSGGDSGTVRRILTVALRPLSVEAWMQWAKNVKMMDGKSLFAGLARCGRCWNAVSEGVEDGNTHNPNASALENDEQLVRTVVDSVMRRRVGGWCRGMMAGFQSAVRDHTIKPYTQGEIAEFSDGTKRKCIRLLRLTRSARLGEDGESDTEGDDVEGWEKYIKDLGTAEFARIVTLSGVELWPRPDHPFGHAVNQDTPTQLLINDDWRVSPTDAFADTGILLIRPAALQHVYARHSDASRRIYTILTTSPKTSTPVGYLPPLGVDDAAFYGLTSIVSECRMAAILRSRLTACVHPLPTVGQLFPWISKCDEASSMTLATTGVEVTSIPRVFSAARTSSQEHELYSANVARKMDEMKEKAAGNLLIIPKASSVGTDIWLLLRAIDMQENIVWINFAFQVGPHQTS